MRDSVNIFIVGYSRSGTTMLSRVLGKADNIYSFNELHFFEQLYSSEEFDKILNESQAISFADQLLDIQRTNYLFYDVGKHIPEAKKIINGLNIRTKPEIFKKFLEFETRLMNKDVACEQTPRNVLYLEELFKIFPDAKVINMVRDPRDVLLSQKSKWKRKFLGADKIPLKESIRSWVNYHPITIGKLWNASVRASLKYQHSNIKTVLFEEFIQCPDQKLKEICSFLNISYDSEMLDVEQAGSSNFRDDSKEKGIRKNNFEKWKKGGLSQGEIFWCEFLNRDEMSMLGYELLSSKISLKSIYYLFSFPFHIIFALMLNLSRMNNVFSSIKKRI
ncbi:MAG: hypothetical protein CMP75_03055 [Flavobacteriales bacterium]|nr:hypothetical protein [Flavobacteriales bacterium]